MFNKNIHIKEFHKIHLSLITLSLAKHREITSGQVRNGTKNGGVIESLRSSSKIESMLQRYCLRPYM